jgi:nucleoid-associated protein YgaU
MRLLLVLLLSLSLGVVGCSSSKSKENKEEVVTESGDEDFVIEEEGFEDGEQVVEDLQESAAEEELVESRVQEAIDSTEGSAVSIDKERNVAGPGLSQYTVQEGETLMLIAFKLYGRYMAWKDLRDWNRDTLQGTDLKGGMILNYQAPAEAFSWNPQGNPYLVKWGDSLSKISQEKYGDWKSWKSIWENNRPMIKDPNLIFAGFTLYYIPARDVASE